MFGRKKDDDFLEDEAWEYDDPSSSSFSSSFSQDFRQNISDSDYAYDAHASAPTLDMGYAYDEPPSYRRPRLLENRFRFSIALPSQLAILVLLLCGLIAGFGIIGAFYTPFSHPSIASFNKWNVDKYLNQTSQIEDKVVEMPEQFQSFSYYANEPLQLANAIQQSQQTLSQLSLANQRLRAPSGYGLFQTTVNNAIDMENNALSAYQQYVSTGQASDESSWKQQELAMDREISYLQNQWRKVK